LNSAAVYPSISSLPQSRRDLCLCFFPSSTREVILPYPAAPWWCCTFLFHPFGSNFPFIPKFVFLAPLPAKCFLIEAVVFTPPFRRFPLFVEAFLLRISSGPRQEMIGLQVRLLHSAALRGLPQPRLGRFFFLVGTFSDVTFRLSGLLPLEIFPHMTDYTARPSFPFVAQFVLLSLVFLHLFPRHRRFLRRVRSPQEASFPSTPVIVPVQRCSGCVYVPRRRSLFFFFFSQVE